MTRPNTLDRYVEALLVRLETRRAVLAEAEKRSDSFVTQGDLTVATARRYEAEFAIRAAKLLYRRLR